MAGNNILYDKQDEEVFLSRKWYISDAGYAVWRGLINGEKQTVRLHRLILGAKPSEIVDHKNRNKLDNRRKNLRICTRSENAENRASKGYCWDSSKQKWLVIYRGRFYARYGSEEEAKRGAQRARSGVPRPNAQHPRRKYLPKGVMYMQPNRKYYIRPSVGGKRIFSGYFNSAIEAEEAYRAIFAERRVTS
jgi:hypothetical protein